VAHGDELDIGVRNLQGKLSREHHALSHESHADNPTLLVLPLIIFQV